MFILYGIILKGSSLHAHSLFIELHNKSFRFFYVCAYMLSSTTKRGRLKVQSCPESYFDVDDNMHVGTNHVYKVYLRIMSQGRCVDHDYGHKNIYTYITREQRHKTKTERFGSFFGLFLSIGIPHY